MNVLIVFNFFCAQKYYQKTLLGTTSCSVISLLVISNYTFDKSDPKVLGMYCISFIFHIQNLRTGSMHWIDNLSKYCCRQIATRTIRKRDMVLHLFITFQALRKTAESPGTCAPMISYFVPSAKVRELAQIL